jgi:uncharacterized membrane protein
MAKWIKEIIISSIVMLILDGAYIALNQRAFENQVASVQRVILQVKPLGAIICYFFLIFGLNYFIISKKRTLLDAFLFGLIIYAVYDSTNYALFKQWKPLLAIMDAIWGGSLFALTTFITYSTA